MSRVTILVGLPGSGKSTIAQQLHNLYGATIVCPDTIRKELTSDTNDQSRNTEVFKIAENRIYEAIFARTDVVYDATNIHRFGRMNLIHKIRACSKDCTVECIIVAPTIDEVRYRNNNRERTVPGEVIDQMLSNWETPMTFEGFDKIYLNDAGDENIYISRMFDRVKHMYDGNIVYIEGESKETTQFHIDLMNVAINNTYQEQRFSEISRDDVVVASTMVHCAYDMPDLVSTDAHRHIGAYKVLTYSYDELFGVDPLCVSYAVESYCYPADAWLIWLDPHTYKCVNDLYSAYEALGYCETLTETAQ